jgi:hypothetical protein
MGNLQGQWHQQNVINISENGPQLNRCQLFGFGFMAALNSQESFSSFC